MEPKVSVIAPVYKTEKFLKKCIDSVIGQTFEDWELILVNDCSPDESYKILEYFENKDNRIRIINHATNQGVDQARFTGLKNARAKYVTFLDSDDWLSRDALRLLYDKIEEEDSDVACGSLAKVFDKYKIFRTKAKNSFAEKNLTEAICQPELFQKYYISYFGVNILSSYMCSKLYRKETIEKAQLQPSLQKMWEDLVFNLRLHPFLTKISFVPETVYYYRYGGMTSSSTPYFLESIKSQYLLKEECIDTFDYSAAQPYIRYELINCFYSHFQNLIMLDRLGVDRVQELIREELKDEFYNKDIFVGINMSEKAFAMEAKDAGRITDILRTNLKKNRAKHVLKKTIAGVMDLF